MTDPQATTLTPEVEHELTRLRQIFASVPGMLYQWVLSPAGEARFTLVSAGCQQVYGLTPEQLLADIRNSLDVVHPDDMPGFQQAVRDSAERLTPFVWTGRINLAQGVTKWIRAHSTPTRLPDGGTRWEGMILDITEQHHDERARRAAEDERAALVEQLRAQNDLLVKQAEALRDLATPVIPLASGVIGLPLVGDIDPTRAAQILEALLNGVTSHRARFAIIDITGVRTIDTFGADALIRSARALQLLGATAVLTGLRPEIAQTLVGLGVELHGLTTLGTFQEGVTFALARARA